MSGEYETDPQTPPTATNGRLGPVVAVVFLAAIVALGTLVRTHGLGRSLWIDELHTAWSIAEGPEAIPARAAAGNYSPAYFFVVWCTTRLAGMNEAALRLPSLIAGILLIVAAWAAVKHWTGSWSLGLLAALTVAVDPDFIFFAGEARAFALIHLLGLAHVLVFRQMLVRRPSFALHAAWCVVGMALFYLHYTSALLIAAEVVCFAALFAVKRLRPKFGPIAMALDVAAIAVLCCPMLPHVLEVAARRDNWALFIEQSPAWALLTAFPLTHYVLMPAVTAGALWAVWWTVRASGVFSASLASATHKRVDTTTVVLLCCWFCVPMVVAWTLTERDVARLFFIRYLMIVALAPILLGSLAGAMLPGRWWRGAFVAAAATGLLATQIPTQDSAVDTVTRWVRFGRPEVCATEDWRGAVAWANRQNARTPLPVLVYSDLIEAGALADDPTPELIEYCLLPVTGLYRLDAPKDGLIPLPTREHWQPSKGQRAIIGRHGGVRLISRGTPELAEKIATIVANTLRREGLIVRRGETKRFERVTVIRLWIER